MTNPIGTTIQYNLSTRQKISMALVWLLTIGGIFAVASVLPKAEENSWLAIVVILGAWFITFRIAMRPAGTPYTQITSPAGLRGEFNIARQWPAMVGIWVGMIALVCIMAIPQEPRGAPVIYGWALTGLIPLFIYGILLIRALDRVTMFRIDDDGAVFIRRGRHDWEPLRVTDYRRIVLRTMSGRSASNIPTRLDFLEPVAGGRKVSIPMMYVKSRRYGTMAYGTIIEEFFRKACERARYHVTMKGGWVALGKTQKNG